MTELPILYSFRRCPYAMRARLAVMASGVETELREIVLRDKAPAFLEASPSATVPCLVEADGTVLDESLDIMLWALERNDPEGWLPPEEARRQEQMALIETIDGPFKRHLDRYKYSTRFEDADRETEQVAAAAYVTDLENRLASDPWLSGETPGLADFAILPFIRQFANTDRDWFDQQSWSGVLRWLRRFETSDRFTAIMGKYPKWTEGDPMTLFGRS